jgi:hypothetical protein
MVSTIYLLAAIAAIVQCIILLYPSLPVKSIIHVTNEPRLFSIPFLRIKGFYKPRWHNFKIISLAMSSFLLLLLALLVSLFIYYKTKVHWTSALIISLIVFTFIPVVSIVDDINSDLRFKNHEPSRVSKSCILHVCGTYQNIFFTSTQALSKIGATLKEVYQPYGRLSAEFGQSNIYVEIKNIIEGKYEIIIYVDSDLPSIRWDFGINQRIIDRFTQRFLGLS